MARLVASVVQGGRQTLAFLDVLAWSEIGPELLAESDDGYNVFIRDTPSDGRPITATMEAGIPGDVTLIGFLVNPV